MMLRQAARRWRGRGEEGNSKEERITTRGKEEEDREKEENEKKVEKEEVEKEE